MELAMEVEPAGWGWLRFADEQMVMRIRASYVSDVLTNVAGVIADVAGGADSAETLLGLEPGLVTLRLERDDDVACLLTLDVESGLTGPHGRIVFPVETRSLAKLGLDLAASVDRETYLESWAPEGTWPTEALERLERLAQEADGMVE